MCLCTYTCTQRWPCRHPLPTPLCTREFPLLTRRAPYQSTVRPASLPPPTPCLLSPVSTQRPHHSLRPPRPRPTISLPCGGDVTAYCCCSASHPAGGTGQLSSSTGTQSPATCLESRDVDPLFAWRTSRTTARGAHTCCCGMERPPQPLISISSSPVASHLVLPGSANQPNTLAFVSSCLYYVNTYPSHPSQPLPIIVSLPTTAPRSHASDLELWLGLSSRPVARLCLLLLLS